MMSMHYCFACRTASGLISPLPTISGPAPTSGYQFDKHQKHSVSGMTGSFNSIFDDRSWGNYQGWQMAGVYSGYLEVDGRGRKSLLTGTGRQIGQTFMSGQYVGPCNGVRVVLSELSGRGHVYPDNVVSGAHTCAGCGRPITSP